MLNQLNNGQNQYFNYDGHEITVVKMCNKKETNTNNLLNALVGFATYILCFARYLYKRSWDRLQVLYHQATDTVHKMITTAVSPWRQQTTLF